MVEIAQLRLQSELELAVDEYGQDLVALYVRTTLSELQDMEKSLQASQWEDILKVSHRAIGASAVLGLREMVRVLKDVEKSAQMKEPLHCRKSLAEVRQRTSQLHTKNKK